jgi:hypothetical protein
MAFGNLVPNVVILAMKISLDSDDTSLKMSSLLTDFSNILSVLFALCCTMFRRICGTQNMPLAIDNFSFTHIVQRQHIVGCVCDSYYAAYPVTYQVKELKGIPRNM